MEFSTDALADRWLEQRKLQNTVGKLTYHYLLKREGEIFESFWSRTKSDISLGLNDGYYVGRDSVKKYYAALADAVGVKSELLRRRFPEKLQDITEDGLHGVGQLTYVPLASPLVELAGDGETARAIWMSQGAEMDVCACGPLGFWNMRCIAADFVLENGQWRVWHLLMLDEINAPQGQSWAKEPELPPKESGFAMLEKLRLPEPDIKASLRERYSPARAYMPLPALPEPYEHFSGFGYGIPGGAKL